MNTHDDDDEEWPSHEERTAAFAQARALRTQTEKGGLRFEAFLPSSLAAWILDKVENGVFLNPSEAVFVLLGECKDLEPHADLRHELLKRRVQAAIDDPRPGLPIEEVMERMRKRHETPRPEPAVWKRTQR